MLRPLTGVVLVLPWYGVVRVSEDPLASAELNAN